MAHGVGTPGRKSLGRQVSWTLAANALYGGCNLLLLVVLNKLGNATEVGKYGLALAVTAPIFMCANLRFATVLASDMRSSVCLKDYFTVRIALVIASLIAVATMLIAGASNELAMLIGVVAVTKSVEAIQDLCCGVQQRIERIDRIAVSLVAYGLAMFGAFLTVYAFTRNLCAAAAALLLARVCVLLLYDLPVAALASEEPVFVDAADISGTSGYFRRETWPRLQELLVASAPLGLTAALMSLASNMPRYVIPAAFDEGMLGIFVSMAIVLQAGGLVFRAVEQPAVPRLALAIHHRDGKRFWTLLGSLCLIFSAIGLVGALASWLVGGRILDFIFTRQFLMMGGVLASMMLATVVGQIAGMVESSLIAARVIRIQVPMHCITVAICFELSNLLIPRLELYGAVLALAICRIPFMLFGVLLLRRKLAEGPVAADGSQVTAADASGQAIGTGEQREMESGLGRTDRAA